MFPDCFSLGLQGEFQQLAFVLGDARLRGPGRWQVLRPRRLSEIVPETAQGSQGKGLRDSFPSIQGYTLLVLLLPGTSRIPFSSHQGLSIPPLNSVPAWVPPPENPSSVPVSEGENLPLGSPPSPAPDDSEAMKQALDETLPTVDVVPGSRQLAFLCPPSTLVGRNSTTLQKSAWIFSLGQECLNNL